MDPSLRAHSEAKGEAIQKQYLDCFVALLLAMTRASGQFRRNLLYPTGSFRCRAGLVPRRRTCRITPRLGITQSTARICANLGTDRQRWGSKTCTRIHAGAGICGYD
jgi:hypothetical protein